MTDTQKTDTQTADAPPTDPQAAPLFQVSDWAFNVNGPSLAFAVRPHDRAEYDRLRHAAAFEFMDALTAVRNDHGTSAEVKAVEDARRAAALNAELVAQSAARVPALERDHADAVRDPRRWPVLDELEQAVENEREKLKRIKARGPILARAVETAEAASVTALRSKLAAELNRFRTQADERIDRALSDLCATASPAVLALVLAFARRPALNDPDAVVKSLLPTPTANRPGATQHTDENADELAAVGEE